MSQLVFKFPFKTTYFEKDFFVSSNNFEAYKLIESWPKWPDKKINIFGPRGCGKTHLTNILSRKLKLLSVNANKFDEKINKLVENFECIVIENYEENIDENSLYSFINQISQFNKYLIINSVEPMNSIKFSLPDLKSRLKNCIFAKIEKPDDDMIFALVLKHFSDRQIQIEKKIIEYISKRIERSYGKILEFIYKVDQFSLINKKSIDYKSIKKILEE